MILTVFPASKVYATKLPPAVLNLATSAGECVGLAGLPEDLVVMKNSNVPEVPISSTDIDPLPFTVDPSLASSETLIRSAGLPISVGSDTRTLTKLLPKNVSLVVVMLVAAYAFRGAIETAASTPKISRAATKTPVDFFHPLPCGNSGFLLLSILYVKTVIEGYYIKLVNKLSIFAPRSEAQLSNFLSNLASSRRAELHSRRNKE